MDHPLYAYVLMAAKPALIFVIVFFAAWSNPNENR